MQITQGISRSVCGPVSVYGGGGGHNGYERVPGLYVDHASVYLGGRGGTFIVCTWVVCMCVLVEGMNI